MPYKRNANSRNQISKSKNTSTAFRKKRNRKGKATNRDIGKAPPEIFNGREWG